MVDQFNLLNPSEQAKLSALLRNIKEKSGVEISVYIPAGLQDHAIEEFSMAVAEKWKLGNKKEDKALLFVFAPAERKMRLEVGYGMEGIFTDAYSRRLLDDNVRPYFKEGRYYSGIVNGIYAVQEKIPLGLEKRAKRRSNGIPDGIMVWIIILVIVLSVLMRIAQMFGLLGYYGGGPRGGGGYGGWGGGGGGWGGGSSGGSSWGGGGGGFGGGGASSDW